MKAQSRLYRPRHARIASITAARAICPCPRLREGSRNSSAERKKSFRVAGHRRPMKSRTPYLKSDTRRCKRLIFLCSSSSSPDCFALFDTQCSFIDFFLQVLAACFFWIRIRCPGDVQGDPPHKHVEPLERRHRSTAALLRAPNHWTTRTREDGS